MDETILKGDKKPLIKIFARVELSLAPIGLTWNKVTVIRDELLEEIDSSVEKLLHEKSRIFESIKSSGVIISDQNELRDITNVKQNSS